MNLKRYEIKNHKRKRDAYEFVSKGKKDVVKVVELQKTDQALVYNLAMCDIVDGKKSYTNITNNGDISVVMQTVGYIIQKFTLVHPERYVFVTGDTPVKTRVYQIYLSKNLHVVQKDFNVWGLNKNGSGFERFTKGKNYSGFLVKRM